MKFSTLMLMFTNTCHDKSLFSLTHYGHRATQHAKCSEKDVPDIPNISFDTTSVLFHCNSSMNS